MGRSSSPCTEQLHGKHREDRAQKAAGKQQAAKPRDGSWPLAGEQPGERTLAEPARTRSSTGGCGSDGSWQKKGQQATGEPAAEQPHESITTRPGTRPREAVRFAAGPVVPRCFYLSASLEGPLQRGLLNSQANHTSWSSTSYYCSEVPKDSQHIREG